MHVRPVVREDVSGIARLFRVIRRECLSYLPDLHTADEELTFFRDHVFANNTLWVADDGAIVGFIAIRDGWVDHLYVQIDAQGRGVGRALLARAQDKLTQFSVWVFQRNAQAIRFYLELGLRATELTDGRRKLRFWVPTGA